MRVTKHDHRAEEEILLARARKLIVKYGDDGEALHAVLDELMRSAIRALGMGRLAHLLTENSGPWYA